MPRGFAARLGALAIAGAALRAFYVLVLARHVPNAGDAQFFQAESNLIAHGHGFVDPFIYAGQHVSVASAAHPPLYPLALSLVSLLGATGELAHRCLGALLGAGTIVLIGLIGRRAGGERVGLLAAAIAALYPILWAADGGLMSETLYGLLIAAALLTALRLHDRREPLAAAALGALVGLAALTRSEALLLLPLLAWPLALALPRRRAALLAASTLACIAVLAPWTIRNASAFHELTLISHNDSTVLAGANCGATYHGVDMGGWQIGCIAPRTKLDEAAQARIWRRQGWRYLKGHAGRLAVVIPVRVLRTWDLWQPRRQVMFAESQARWAAKAGVVAYFLLMPFALAGLVLVRRERAVLLILLAPAALAIVQSAAGYGVPRFRHAVEISIVVLAAVTISRLPALTGRWRSGRARLRAAPTR